MERCRAAASPGVCWGSGVWNHKYINLGASVEPEYLLTSFPGYSAALCQTQQAVAFVRAVVYRLHPTTRPIKKARPVVCETGQSEASVLVC